MNIAEILKNCPKGTKLYSPIFGDIEFECINPNGNISCSENLYRRIFYPDGKYSEGGEVMLFPSKEQHDWNEFLIPFEDGDIIISIGQTPKFPYENVAIFKEYNNRNYENKITIYCQFNADGEFNDFEQRVNHHNWRKATIEEEQEFFKRLHKKGYDLVNGELVKRFEYGDVIAIYNENYGGYSIGIFDKYLSNRFCKLLCVTNLETNNVEIIDENYNIANGWDAKNARYANHIEKVDLLVELDKIGYEWKDDKLVKIIKPTFKLGDTITNGKNIVRITGITKNFYRSRDINDNFEYIIPIIRECDWKPAKFNIESLKPYDKVLVREEGESSIWYPTLVSYVITNGVYTIDADEVKYEVIPFEPNKHLIGKSLDPDPYYITWYDTEN